MSALAVIGKINKKLDEGWKMSDQTCPICKTIIVGHPKTKEFYCVKCEMPCKIFPDDEDYEVEVISASGNNNSGSKQKKDSSDTDSADETYENMVMKREAERRRTDELSKKMGQYLLQGWAMLEEVCDDCLFPLMRSKKAEVICVGCGPVNQKKEAKQAQKQQASSQEEKKIEAPREFKTEPQPSQRNMSTLSSTQSNTKPNLSAAKPEEKTEIKTKENTPISTIVSSNKDESKPIQTLSNAESNLFKLGKFDESVDFYSHITGLLKREITTLSQVGLVSNLENVKKLIDLQISIDESKKGLLKFTNQPN